MVQGKRPPNPFLHSDFDSLEYIELIEAFGSGAETSPDAPISLMTAISFARIAEGAVYQHKSSFPNGRVGEFQARAQRLMENCIAEECFSSGSRATLEGLLQVGALAQNFFTTASSGLAEYEAIARREAARQCAALLRQIEAFAVRKGVRGRPIGGKADDLLSLWDSMLLRDALMQIEPGKGDTRDAIAEQVPIVVRSYVKFGQLPSRGETLQDCVDIHTKRIVRLLDTLPKTSRSYRGFSIKRRD